MDKMKKVLREWVLPFALEILAVLLVIKFVFFLAMVPSGSMLPTIEEGSWLFVTRMYLPDKTVQRGDILVFESDELGMTLIKRVVGLPGEEVVVDEAGQLYVNGEQLPEDYVVYPSDRSGAFQVPEGHYLFMGDNRAGSNDARYWQNPYIPADKLMGEARFVLWPLHKFGFLH